MKTFNCVIYFLIFIVFSVGIYILFIQNDDNMQEDNLILKDNIIYLNQDEERKINAYVENNSNAVISYQSSDTSVVTVKSNGIVKGISEGTATILITYKNESAKCDIVVKGKEVVIESIKFPKDYLLIKKGEKKKIEYTLEPNVKPSNINFTSLNEGILKVDDDGNILALSNGTAIIRMEVGAYLYKDLNVFVKDDVVTDYIDIPSSISVKESNMILKIGEEKKINLTISPSNASCDIVVFTSSDESIVKVSNGKIKGIHAGKAIVIIESVNNVRTYVSVEVKENDVKVQGIHLTTNEEFYIGLKEVKHLPYEIIPSNATNQEVILTSSNGNVSLLNDGNILGVTRGYVDVYIETKDGGFKEKVTVRVRTGIDDPTITAPKNGVNKSCSTGRGEDTAFNSCFVNSHNLSLQGISGNNATITMKVGETKSIRVNIPSECGSLSRWTRRSADGQEDWNQYVTQSFGSADSRGYTWIITANRVGNVTVSQTAQYDSLSPSGVCTGNVKSMYTLNINIR